MTAQFECQETGCDTAVETPAEAMTHTATTGHTLTKETDDVSWTISLADEDEGDEEL